MKEGSITWDPVKKRPDIRYDDGTCCGGLHCGNTLEVLVRGKWQPTRIEYRWSTGSWYLVGLENDEEILWLTVKN